MRYLRGMEQSPQRSQAVAVKFPCGERRDLAVELAEGKPTRIVNGKVDTGARPVKPTIGV